MWDRTLGVFGWSCPGRRGQTGRTTPPTIHWTQQNHLATAVLGRGDREKERVREREKGGDRGRGEEKNSSDHIPNLHFYYLVERNKSDYIPQRTSCTLQAAVLFICNISLHTCPSLRVAPLRVTPLCWTRVMGTTLPGGGSCLLWDFSLLLLAPEPPSLTPDAAFFVSFFRA